MRFAIRFISLLLAVLCVIGGTMLIAFAEGEEEIGGETPVVDPDPVTPDPVTPDPVTPDPVTPDPVTPDPVTPDPVTPDPVTPDNNISGDGTDYNTNYNTNNDPIYYGDASNYDYNASANNDGAAGSVSQQTQLFNTSGISAEEAKPSTWSDITLDEKTVKTGVADFSSIKTNTETTDNGNWMMYLGYLLLILSGLGILYFIIATIAARKAYRKAERMERRRSASGPAHTAAARMEEHERREASAHSPRTSHYSDEAPARSRRVSSKADTGEIYVPRRVAKKPR